MTDVQDYEAEAPRQIGRLLNLEPGAAVIVRSRKFVVEDRPVQIATSYLPADLVRDTAIAQPNTGPGGSYARLAELGAEPVAFAEELRARMPGEEERAALNLAAGTPVLEICRTAFTEDERPVEVNQMLLDRSADCPTRHQLTGHDHSPKAAPAQGHAADRAVVSAPPDTRFEM